jgi:hypothetical protein
MSERNPYLEADQVGAWFRSQAGKVPRPLNETDLAGIEQQATEAWTEASPDLLRLVAEVRGLRALVTQLKEELKAEE